MEAVRKSFGYLVPRGEVEGKPKVKRAVAALEYSIIEPFQPFFAAGLKMVPLPVMHGEDLICMGFSFTIKGMGAMDAENTDAADKDKATCTDTGLNVVYLSDISRMLPETQEYILNKLPPTDVLIIDSLLENRPNNVHFNLQQALDLARTLKPKRTFIVGMNCDSFRPHEEMNEELKKVEGLEEVQLAHDGLVIEVP